MGELLGKDFLCCSDKRADLLWAEDWRWRGDPQLLLLLLLVVMLATGIDGAVVAKRLLLLVLVLVLVLVIVGTRSVSAGAVVMMARASRAPSADVSIVHVVSRSR